MGGGGYEKKKEKKQIVLLESGEGKRYSMCWKTMYSYYHCFFFLKFLLYFAEYRVGSMF